MANYSLKQTFVQFSKKILAWVKSNCVNNLVSDATNLPLAAAQGKKLQGEIDTLNSNLGASYATNVKDLNNPPAAFLLNTGTNPIGFPAGLGGNGCCVIQQNFGKDSFASQLAFSFTSDKIAIRRKNASSSWTDWAYFTAQ